MTDPGRYFDADPRPRRSPRLFAEVEDVPGSVAPVSMRPSGPSAAVLRRMRLLIAVKAMKDMEPPATNRIIADTLKISVSTVHRLRRLIEAKEMRRGRV